MTDTQVELTWCGVDLAASVQSHKDLLLQPLYGRLLLIQPPLPLHQLLRILTTPTQDLFSLGQVPTAYTTHQHNTSTQHINTTHQHNTSTQHINTIHQHNTSTQHINTTHQHNTSTQYINFCVRLTETMLKLSNLKKVI